MCHVDEQSLNRVAQLNDFLNENTGIHVVVVSHTNFSQLNHIMEQLEHKGIYEMEHKAEKILTGLGFKESEFHKPIAHLSGGWQMRTQLAKMLTYKYDLILLDEPTNYLDVEHIEWLKRYLKNYENSFILVSHDIPFLNEVVNVIYHVESTVLTRYSGDYDQFQQMFAMRKGQELRAYERQQQEVERMEDFIARNKARVATRGMANSRQKRLDKMEVLEKPREKPKPVFQFREARTPGRFIVEASGLVLGYDEPLTRPVDIALERGQKVALRGVNGLGKSTLLKTLLGQIPPLSGKV